MPKDTAAPQNGGPSQRLDAAHFTQHILTNRYNRAILERLPQLGLPDAWLVAGCLFQTVWNLQSGQSSEAQISDHDLFYFDPTDLSAEAERIVQARVDEALGLACQGCVVEVKNQARVHTWYEAHFGHPYPALQGSRDGIDRFLIPCTCVGVRVVPGDAPWAERIEVYAPNGLHDLYAGRLAMNPVNAKPDLFHAKAASYRARWPWLTVTQQQVHR